MNKKMVIISIVTIIVFFGLFIGIQTKKSPKTMKKERVVAVGLKPSQQEYFSKQLSGSFNEVALLEKGTSLMSQGKLDEAAEHFKNLLADKKFELKGNARAHLIDIYEKKREYDKAYAVLSEDVQKNYKVPPEHEARVPVEERLKYLQYAINGDYDFAVEHARLALEASKKLPLSLKDISMSYQRRLEDLVAAKDYILSLKKQ